MIKVLVAEDSDIVRKGIIRVLNKEADLEVVGESENGQIALDLLQNGLVADILLTDLNMPVMDGLELIRFSQILQPKLKAIVLTMHTDRAFLEKALAAGTQGYLLKNGNMDELTGCIRDVNSGKLVIDKDFT